MKTITATLIVVLALVGLAAVADQMGWLATTKLEASPAAQALVQRAGAAPAAPAASTALPPPPTFDGNVANLVWGGRLESVSYEKMLAYARTILVDPFPGKGGYTTRDNPGPVDIVISFFKRDSARIRAVTITAGSNQSGLRDVEVWTSSVGAAEGFTKVAETSVPLEPNAFKPSEGTLSFPPVDARFVKVRLANHHPNGSSFGLTQVKVMEAEGAGYVSLVRRHPEIAEPAFVAEGAVAAAAQPPPTAGCAPAQGAPMQPGNGETRDVLLVMKETVLGAESAFVPLGLKTGKYARTLTAASGELKVFDRVTTEPVIARHAQPYMLADYDTVVFEQVCEFKYLPAALPSGAGRLGRRRPQADPPRFGQVRRQRHGLQLAPVPDQDEHPRRDGGPGIRAARRREQLDDAHDSRAPGVRGHRRLGGSKTARQRTRRFERRDAVGSRLVRPHGRP